MPLSTRTVGFALLALLTAGTVQASTYTFSGRLGDTVYTGPLNGGSFSGTFYFTRPSIGSFDVLLLDAGRAVRFELTNANSRASFFPNFGGSGYDAVQFVTLGPEASATILSLNFALGFTGVGAVIPFPTGFPYASFATLGGQTTATTSTVASGFSSAVPEPASWALLAGGTALLLFLRRRSSSG